MSIAITRHLDAATLVSLAAGTLSEPLAAVAASHIAMCPTCRTAHADMELFGAALLETTAAGAADPDEVVLPERPREDHVPAVRPVSPVAAGSPRLPSPIAIRYGLAYDDIPWKRLAPGIWHHRLALSPGSEGDLRLLKIAAGKQMPGHGHGGGELTLVLDGAYRDESGHYRCGDVQDIDEHTEHRPVADPELGCVCLIASERPARFHGIVGRLLQPLTGL